ncbi:MAG: hypothetical protein A3E98_03090 [Candidatus Doudnabacteria bacterium RIFCSPHIGHO2_12_FULL_48_11]|uniref:DUF86 domain-containing protein n=1 Tax=Candidatus Doudnabacteria bacterium RIFCSPHIGHO2_01_FULL_46_24 TaxID=1817825 RepID=A0A1F5NTH5_9BACT|nr:MAG: hypothetical protein A2720_03625 [Candidatus Doudnabacteria bacterium RIFCSPHIGHO2_01_FULL_46_24]OGE96025.1 MAG: hypothetical protein A3E98_03090 [Candidatus Doudnabacteria bacterium RIFCSPHIGHO2_12_FULL_48_11]
MNHKEWVKNQFRAVKGRTIYRDVIIHASFVETATKQLGMGQDFQCSIKILNARCPESKKEIDKLEQLRKMRNRMVHDLLKDEHLTNAEVIKTIRSMKKLLREIYNTENGIIKKHFEERHQIDTRDFK